MEHKKVRRGVAIKFQFIIGSVHNLPPQINSNTENQKFQVIFHINDEVKSTEISQMRDSQVMFDSKFQFNKKLNYDGLIKQFQSKDVNFKLLIYSNDTN